MTLTDKLDVHLIAGYGEAIKALVAQVKPETMRLMSDLLSRRRLLNTLKRWKRTDFKSCQKNSQY